MNNSIKESFNFLLAEYKRLKLKEKNRTLSREEKESLQKLSSFIGKKNDE